MFFLTFYLNDYWFKIIFLALVHRVQIVTPPTTHLLLIAESNTQGIFVAPNTRTFLLSTPTPCIWTKNSVLILLADSDSFSLRDPHNASTSSINIILGLCSLAAPNNVLTNL